MFQLIVIVSITAFLGGAFVLAHLYERKRQEALRLMAEQLGLEYFTSLSEGDYNRFRRFPISHSGRSPSTKSTIVAETDAMRMLLFDFQFVTGNGKNQHTHTIAILMCHSSQLRLPVMTIDPENWGNKIAAYFGQKDIDIEGDEPFSKQFRINGPDENAILAFLTPERRKLLMERPNERLQTHTDSFLILRKQSKLTANSLHQLMEDGLIVAKLLGATHQTNENSSPEMDEEFEDSEEADTEEEA